MKRLILPLALILAFLFTGCAKTPPPKPAGTADQPQPTPVATEQPQGQSDSCKGPITAGPPSVALRFMGIYMPLPMSDCSISLPAGQINLSLQISNLQKPGPVEVTGAPEGQWSVDKQQYQVAFTLAAGEKRTVSLAMGADLSPVGKVTYTFTGDPALASLIASGPSRQGPWQPVKGDLIPADHGWLRLAYPRPMKAGDPSPISNSQYAMQPDAMLTGEWEGDRVQYIDISQQPPVLYMQNNTADVNGLQMYLGVWRLHRGAPPVLQRIAAATLNVQPVYTFTSAPGTLGLRNGLIEWRDSNDTVQQIDPASGSVKSAPVPPTATGVRSPDGKYVAEFLPLENRPLRDPPVKTTVNLIIRESGSGQAAAQVPLSTWGSYGCSRGTPGVAWRANSQEVAVLDAPSSDTLVLKAFDLKGNGRTIGEWQQKGVGYRQTSDYLTWSPDSKLITMGAFLVDAESGKVITTDLLQYAFWSPDSNYLLLYGPDHPFTPWGTVDIVNMTNHLRQPLGHGQGLGWTPGGEALLVRWDLSKQIPAPGKGCLP
ncbi:MAG: hypothetical protein ACM3XM_07025 [Mycobacterium leprae]